MVHRIKNITLILASTCLFSCNGSNNKTSNDSKLEEDSLISLNDTITNVDSSQEDGLSDDIIGTYKGTLPCADCEGIETTIEINKDGSFKKSDQYLTNKNPDENLFKDKGMIDWNEEDSIITLISTVDTTKLKYKINGNELKALNRDGSEISDLIDEFTLTKE